MSDREIRLRLAELHPTRPEGRAGDPDLLRRIYEVDPLQCPACGAEMRIIAFILLPAVIDRILAHIRDKGRNPRAGPWLPPAESAPAHH